MKTRIPDTTALSSVRPLSLIGVLALAVAACGGDSWSMWMGDARAEMPAGISADQLPDSGSEGAHLVARYCSTCHGIPSPSAQAARDWPSITRRMFRRAGHMASMGGMMRRMHPGRRLVEAPTLAERRRILTYLQEHALTSIDEGSLTETDAPARLFARTCSRCHALPDPAQHTAEQWPGVVARMRTHMKEAGVAGIDDSEADSIQGFLERSADREKP